jgi:hypothetical protein
MRPEDSAPGITISENDVGAFLATEPCAVFSIVGVTTMRMSEAAWMVLLMKARIMSSEARKRHTL